MEEIYLVTEKHVYCDHRCTGTTIFNCLECRRYFNAFEETQERSKSQLLNLINNGCCYITKVKLKQ